MNLKLNISLTFNKCIIYDVYILGEIILKLLLVFALIGGSAAILVIFGSTINKIFEAANIDHDKFYFKKWFY
jgi:hypothetical protein